MKEKMDNVKCHSVSSAANRHSAFSIYMKEVQKLRWSILENDMAWDEGKHILKLTISIFQIGFSGFHCGNN